MDYKEIEERMKLMITDAQERLKEELYPKKLGDLIKVRDPMQRLVILAAYEGYANALRDLGADTKDLDDLITAEINKISRNEYNPSHITLKSKILKT